MNDESLAVRVAELYYYENKTQDEIGAILKISRWKAGRLLSSAREQGIVHVEIAHPRARRGNIERAVRQRYGLDAAVVVPAPEEESDALSTVGQAAADYLAAMRPVPKTLAVSWGPALAATVDHLADGWAHDLTVVQMNGGVSLNRRPGGASRLAAGIAQRAAGSVMLLPSPAIVGRIETKRAVAADPTVTKVLASAAEADTYLFTAGACDDTSPYLGNGYLSEHEIVELSRRGAVGEVIGRYIDADGNIVDPELDARTVGIDLERLRSAPVAVFVTAGGANHDIARAVLRNDLCTALVTDEATARVLLE